MFGQGSLFGWYHPPSGEVSSVGVVLCSPIGAEQQTAYRGLRLLAERLAAGGVAVLRFDYHGTGNSLGQLDAPDLVSKWIADIGRAVDALAEVASVTSVRLVGVRLGATLATLAAAQRGDIAAVALVRPCLRGSAFLREMRFSARFATQAGPRSGRTEAPDSVVGFEMSEAAERDVGALDLLKLDAAPCPRALVIGCAQALLEQPLVTHLDALGVDTEVRHFPGASGLTLDAAADPGAEAIVLALLDWAASPDVSSRPVTVRSEESADPQSAAVLREEPLVLGGGGRLFGILSEPAPGRRRRDCPTILLLNPSVLNPEMARDMGSHPLCVALSRRWAELGFSTFRFDLAGSSTPAAASGDYAGEAEEAVRDAMATLGGARGATRFILVGFCLGATLTFRVTLRQPNVVGSVMVNPGFFYAEEGKNEVARRVDARVSHYRRLLFRPETWKRVLSGRVDFGVAARVFESKLKAMLRPLRERGQRRGDTSSRPARDLVADLRSMSDRGVDTLLVYSREELGLDYVERHYGPRIRALGAEANFRMEIMEGDHAFLRRTSRDQLIEILTSHLVARYP